MRIIEFDQRESIRRLREEWRALYAECPDRTPFQTWEWNDTWWRHFGARKRLRLLTFRGEAGDLRGLVPLYTSWHLGTPLRRLAWIGTGTSDYLDLLARPEHQEEVTAALFAHLEERMRGWDMADLQQLRPCSPLHRSNGMPWPRRSPEAQSLLPMEPCPYLALPASWDDLTKRLGKKMRSNLGYYDRLLLKTFPDAEYLLADATTLETGMTALFDLHQKRWNARWLPGVLGNRRVQAFHRDVAAQFLEQGWLRLHLLRIEGSIRSVLYCFASGERTFYYLGGFAPELGKYSLGTLLTGRAIRQAIEEGHTEFDFLRGREPYKYRWLPEERVNARLLLLRSRERLGSLGELPGRAGLALNRMERYVEHHAKAFAEQQGRRNRAPEKEREKAAANLPSEAIETEIAVVKIREKRQSPS